MRICSEFIMIVNQIETHFYYDSLFPGLVQIDKPVIRIRIRFIDPDPGFFSNPDSGKNTFFQSQKQNFGKFLFSTQKVGILWNR